MTANVILPSRRVQSRIDEVLADMGGERIDDAASIITSAIHEQVRGLADELYAATRQSTRANLGLITTKLADASDPTRFAAPEEALSYARGYVREGLSLETLIRVYRAGEQAYSRLWLKHLGECVDDAEELAQCHGYFSDWLFSYIGAISRPLTDVYTAERERQVRSGVAMRSEEVRAILSGAHVNVGEASSRLGYRLESRHVAFVIWDETPELEEASVDDGYKLFADMESLAAEVAGALGATSSLRLPSGRLFFGWAAVGAQPSPDDLPRGRDGLQLAVGRAGRGVEGFRRSHREALLARRVATLSQRPRGKCVDYSSVALDALLTQDLDEARRFVTNELGALVHDDSDGNRRLAATLEVFLDEKSSFVRAARRLGIHENTVAYRVRQAEELLGRSVVERQLELRAALRLAHVASGAGVAPELLLEQ